MCKEHQITEVTSKHNNLKTKFLSYLDFPGKQDLFLKNNNSINKLNLISSESTAAVSVQLHSVSQNIAGI